MCTVRLWLFRVTLCSRRNSADCENCAQYKMQAVLKTRQRRLSGSRRFRCSEWVPSFCGVELTSAFPYFGFIAMLSGYVLSFPLVLFFVLLYDFIYVLPLLLLYFGYNSCGVLQGFSGWSICWGKYLCILFPILGACSAFCCWFTACLRCCKEKIYQKIAVLKPEFQAICSSLSYGKRFRLCPCHNTEGCPKRDSLAINIYFFV